MVEVRKTDEFASWLDGLRDLRARARIQVRIQRMSEGNTGDAKSVGCGVFEMRVDHGPGYRVYFVRQGVLVVILLCGGDKSSQRADIALAKRLARALEE